MFDAKTASLGNERVKEYLYAVRQNKNKKSIIMEFVYNKKFSRNIDQKIKNSEIELETYVKDNDLPEPTFNWIDIDELWNLYEKGVRERVDKSPWPIPFKNFKDDALCLKFNKSDLKSNAWFDLKEFGNTDSRTVVILIDAWVVKRLYDKYGNFLFNENIRLFQGKNKTVNAGIIETIGNSPEKFFCL